ncbi:WD-REPEATS-REGION domain-containing protein [Mycena kentingensis (nom. inval.)]|nr:WD-REPEATS-REGION domain-containing protein [Mycena kentingensis (nom. inval.)]
MPLLASPLLLSVSVFILANVKMHTPGPAEVAHGPMFLGLTMNILLYGIMITQMYLYITTYKRDSRFIKSYVAILMLADTLNTGFITAYLYESLIVHFGKHTLAPVPASVLEIGTFIPPGFIDDLAYLAKANWVFATDPAMTGIIGSMVQLFYAWRIQMLTGNTFIVVLVVICALTNAFGGLASAAAIAFVPQFAHFQEFQVPVICWLLSAAVGDVLITTTLVVFFRKHKTGCSATDTRVDQIIRLTIQTGMITSICSVIDLGLFLGDWNAGLVSKIQRSRLNKETRHLLFNLPLAKLYSNSLMSSLNARGGWRRVEDDSGEAKSVPLHLSVNVPGPGPNANTTLGSTTNPMSSAGTMSLLYPYPGDNHTQRVVPLSMAVPPRTPGAAFSMEMTPTGSHAYGGIDDVAGFGFALDKQITEKA